MNFTFKGNLSKGGIALQVANLPKAETPTVANGLLTYFVKKLNLSFTVGIV